MSADLENPKKESPSASLDKSKNPTVSVDCLGDFCPIPALKTKTAIGGLAPGETARVLVDHSCAVRNIQEIVPHDGFALSWQEVANGIWEITITRL